MITSSSSPFERPSAPSAHATGRGTGTASASSLRVVIAEERSMLREGLTLLLNLRAGVLVVAATESVSALPALLVEQRCDVLLLGVGLDSLPDVAMFSAMTRVLVLATAERVETAVAALRAGAHGAIFHRESADVLIEAIVAVAAGQVWLPPEMQARLTETLQDDPRRRLTPREREIVRHVALGMRNAEVARKLFITEQTVKTHLGHIFRKTGSRDRMELASYAARLGIVGLGERLA